MQLNQPKQTREKEGKRSKGPHMVGDCSYVLSRLIRPVGESVDPSTHIEAAASRFVRRGTPSPKKKDDPFLAFGVAGSIDRLID